MLPFFGLGLDYKQHLHAHLFDLVFHGNGGFSWDNVYNMPIWARKFYIKKIIDFKEAQRKAEEQQSNKIKSSMKKR
jgi:hypothetical protein